MKDMGRLSYFLGVKVVQDAGRIRIGQSLYASQLLQKHQMSDCKPVDTSIETNAKLVCALPDDETVNDTEFRSILLPLL